MRAILDGRSYDMAVLQSPKLNDLYYLRVETGLSLTAMQKTMQRFDSQFGGLTEGAVMEAMEDIEFLKMLRAIFWLVRRAAGEHLTVDEANDFSITTMRFIADEPDPEPEQADPQTPVTGSALGSGVPVPADASSGGPQSSVTTSGVPS